MIADAPKMRTGRRSAQEVRAALPHGFFSYIIAILSTCDITIVNAVDGHDGMRVV